MFIIVNHPVRHDIQTNLRLNPAKHMVLDPSQYNGNTMFIVGCGQVKGNTADPHMVTITENISR